MSEEERVEESIGVSKRPCGLVVDFDYAFIDGIRNLEEVVFKTLSSVGVDTAAISFPRSLFGARTGSALNALLGAGAAVSVENVLLSLVSEMDKAVEGTPVNAGVVEICRQAVEQGVRVLFMTTRSPAIVEQKLEAAGFSQAQLFKVDRCDRLGEYTADSWGRAARALRLAPRYCTVLATSAMSIRQAVMTGMRTVAIVNPTLSFQDFAGADFVSDAITTSEHVEAAMSVVVQRVG